MSYPARPFVQSPDEPAEHARYSVEKELEIARRIQASFLPLAIPQVPGWEIEACFEPARQVSGDFYDAFMLSNGKRLGIVIADVCDKGVGAALFMALVRSLIRAFADQHYSLGWVDVLAGDLNAEKPRNTPGRRRELLSTGTIALKNAVTLTNKYVIQNHGHTSMFATLFFGILDPASGSLMYINAGHEPPAVTSKEGVRARLNPTGPAIGLIPGAEYSIGQVDINPGEILLAFTDGVGDAMNPAGEFFSEERLLDILQEPVSSADSLLANIREALHQHISGAIQFDDITMLAVHRQLAIVESK